MRSDGTSNASRKPRIAVGRRDRRAGRVEAAQIHVQLAVREAVARPGAPSARRARSCRRRRCPTPRRSCAACRRMSSSMRSSALAAGEAVDVRRQLRGRGERAGARPRVGRSPRRSALCSVAQLGPGFGAELVGEPLAEGGVAVERLGVAARGVQRSHQQALERLGQRVLGDEVGQRRRSPAPVRSSRSSASRPTDGRVEPPPVPGRADPADPLAREAGERRATPQAQRLGQCGRPLVVGPRVLLRSTSRAKRCMSTSRVRRPGRTRRCGGRAGRCRRALSSCRIRLRWE